MAEFDMASLQGKVEKAYVTVYIANNNMLTAALVSKISYRK